MDFLAEREKQLKEDAESTKALEEPGVLAGYPQYGREAATGAEEICAAVPPALQTASNPDGK